MPGALPFVVHEETRNERKRHTAAGRIFSAAKLWNACACLCNGHANVQYHPMYYVSAGYKRLQTAIVRK